MFFGTSGHYTETRATSTQARPPQREHTSGWSVSTDKLKVETPDGKAVPMTEVAKASEPTSEYVPTKNMKRKRPGNPPGAQNITAANFADMWEKVIEQKDTPAEGVKPLSRKEKKLAKKAQKNAASGEIQPEKKAEKQQQEPRGQPEKGGKKEKKNKGKPSVPGTQPAVPKEEDDEWGGFDDDTEASLKDAQAETADEPEKGRKRKKQKTKNEPRSQDEATSVKNKVSDQQSFASRTPAPPPPPAVKLTPLQVSMREKLVSARFRHLNETLYTRPSADAFQLFQEFPEMFTEYHEGFRRQVDVWPENPVEGYVGDIEARAKVRFPPKNTRHDFANPIASIRLLPLPRSTRNNSLCTIADLGCGDAALATRLQPKLDKLRVDIKSFDLQTGGSPLVTPADIANLPLADGSVDVAVFCLALMGTNWLDFVEESYRILRWKGELWIAEIKSRFTNPNASKKQKVVSHSVGNRRNPPPAAGTVAAAAAATSKKSKKRTEAAEAEAEADRAELAVAVDGVELRRQETDISAFVDALRARGFLLHKEMGAGAVDLDNKMFVKMTFVKVAPATKGKYAEKQGSNMDRMGAHGPARKGKFITDDEECFDETAILKPCVYKQR
ncbi:methyltransferase-domain-containing protein [Immersiella caudata]|uniref:Ribosomal RNA-processing protein 8 n=1 Tax=Immersiella caudata TaxID=314043 RepID=A0AA39WQR8_9PEZI|nr:methyltransferase-domain-containing protein [Immersiella caudata]